MEGKTSSVSASAPEHGQDNVLPDSDPSSQGTPIKSVPDPSASPAESTTEAANSAKSYPEVDSMGGCEATAQPAETVSWIFHAF